MKPGDLLKMRIDLAYTYGGDEVPWDEEGNLIRGNISIPHGTIVTVLKVVSKFNGDPRENSYYKILAPGGVGWVWCNYVSEVVSETR